MKKIFLFLLLPSFCFCQLSIQSQVFDYDTKQTIPMANVRLVGTTQGTLTNIDGKFKINADKNRKIAISYVGYETQIFEAASFPNEVYLRTSSLDEVIVMPDSMLRILMRNAYNAIDKNYHQQKIQLSGFYRETVEDQKDPKYYYYSENLIDVLKPSYNAKNAEELGQVRVNKTRTIKLPEYEKLGVRFYGGTYAPIWKDLVQKRSDVLKPSEYFKYYHSLKKIIKYDGRDTYLIEVVPSKDTTIVCNLFIDKKTLAYTKIEVEKINSDSETKLITLFEQHNNLWVLKAFQGIESNYKAVGKTLKITAEFVNTNFKTDSLKAFTFDEQMIYTESVTGIEGKPEISFQDNIEGLYSPDLAQKQFKSFYKPAFIDTVKAKVSYKVEPSSLNKENTSQPPIRIVSNIFKHMQINISSFNFIPYVANSSVQSLKIPSESIDYKGNAQNTFFATWNVKLTSKINRRWAYYYNFSLLDFSKYFTANDYRFQFGELGISYLMMANKGKKPIEILPSVGILRSKQYIPFGKHKNKAGFTSFTPKTINSEEVKINTFQNSYSAKIGVDFNFTKSVKHHIKVGVHYTLPFVHSDQKIGVEEVEKGLKTNKYFYFYASDSKIQMTGQENFQKPTGAFWLNLSYNWGL